MTTRAPALAVAVLACLAVGTGCGPEQPAPPTGGFPVGAVLPFTGDLGAVGSNLERALLLAADAVNRSGGIGGQRLRLAVRDDHSDVSRGLSVAQDLISRDKVVAIIGPESENLAKLLVPLVEMNDTLLISPGVTSELTTTTVPKDLWFKVVPSVSRFGRELAQRMWADGVRTVSIVYTADELGTGFASVLVGELKMLGAVIAALVPVQAEQRGFSDDVRKAVAPAPDGLVLVCAPRTGAAIIHDWSVARARGRWYFSPQLKTELFVQNVPPRVLDGMYGISARISGDAAAFRDTYTRRWHGEEPVTSAYFYYDALALLALSAEAAATRVGFRPPTAIEVRNELRAVANPPGEVVTWNQLERGLALVRAGMDIDYQGVSGTVDLGATGEVSGAAIQFWSIRDNRIVDE